MTAVSVEAAIARARAAVVGVGAQLPALQELEGGARAVMLDPASGTGSIPNLRVVPVQSQELPVPLVHIKVREPSTAPTTSLRPSCELLEALQADSNLSPAAKRLHALLHRLALDVAQERQYAVLPNSVVFHVPAALMALALGVSRQRLYRVLPQLLEAGLVAQGGHVSRVGHQNLYDGCLWSIKLKPGAVLPKLRHDDWQHAWRDFSDDLAAKRTASSLCLQLQTEQVNAEGIYSFLKQWAVIPGSIEKPVKVAVNSPGREVIYRLGELVEAHPKVRTALIGKLAAALARMFNDHYSRRLYAWLLHRGVEAEYRGINALSALSHALQRLLADVAEWSGLRRPGALLVSRLKAINVWDCLCKPTT